MAFCEKARLELATRASHDWLIVAASMYLARATVRTQAHCEVCHSLKGSKNRLFIIPEVILVNSYVLHS
jgi:hypothetical protein